jgi:hypothetical protein
MTLILTGVRHGQSAQVQNTMLEFNSQGKPVWDFKGKNILKGESLNYVRSFIRQL